MTSSIAPHGATGTPPCISSSTCNRFFRSHHDPDKQGITPQDAWVSPGLEKQDITPQADISLAQS